MVFFTDSSANGGELAYSVSMAGFTAQAARYRIRERAPVCRAAVIAFFMIFASLSILRTALTEMNVLLLIIDVCSILILFVTSAFQISANLQTLIDEYYPLEDHHLSLPSSVNLFGLAHLQSFLIY